MAPGFWDDTRKAQAVNRRRAGIQQTLDRIEKLSRDVDDAKVLLNLPYVENGHPQQKLDLYLPAQPKGPLLVWIHGGALIMGHREGIDQRLKQTFLEKEYAVVSIDYRLAPETQLPQIIEDVEDAFRWIRDKGPELFDADPRAIAVSGGSAGGYLTLVTGYRIQPRPVALVAFCVVQPALESYPLDSSRWGGQAVCVSIASLAARLLGAVAS